MKFLALEHTAEFPRGAPAFKLGHLAPEHSRSSTPPCPSWGSLGKDTSGQLSPQNPSSHSTEEEAELRAVRQLAQQNSASGRSDLRSYGNATLSPATWGTA